MVIFSEPPHIPQYRRSPDLSPPNYKALAIGINYTRSPDGSAPGGSALPLQGAVDDAKNIKETLKDVYHYREQDILLMTDEEGNRGTEMWPSASNILQAIDNLVRGASPGDVFVFYYAGHGARQESVNDDDNEAHIYIIACDSNNILDDTLREHLVDPLPTGSRLTAIMDACYSGPLLALNHYRCHRFLSQRHQSLSVTKKVNGKVSRRHTEAAGTFWVTQSAAFLRRTRRFALVAKTTVAVIRLKSRVLKRSKSKSTEGKVEEESPQSTSPTPTPIVVRCDICNRVHDPSDVPDVISLSPCTKVQRTWEYSTRKGKGKGMTVKLIKILNKDPSINVGDLNQQLNRCLSKLSFKRVRKATGAFRRLGELVPPRRKEELEQKYKSLGAFEFKGQTAEFGSLRPLRPDDVFIVARDWTEDQPD